MSRVTPTRSQKLLTPLSPRCGGVEGGGPLPGWSRGLPLPRGWRAQNPSPRHSCVHCCHVPHTEQRRVLPRTHGAGATFIRLPQAKRQGGRAEGAEPCP